MLHPDVVAQLRRVVQMGDEAPSQRERCALLREVRELVPEAAEYIDQELVKQLDRFNQKFVEARNTLAALHEQHERLTAPPWHIAVYRQAVPDTQQAVVWLNGVPRTVTFAEGLAPDGFQCGDEVFLNSELNVLVCATPWGSSQLGETAEFARRIDEHRIVVRWRDEETVAEMAGPLRDCALEEGDQVRWNRELYIAYEKLERTISQRHFIDEVQDVQETAVGGQFRALEAIKAALLTGLVAPDKAARYGLRRRQSLLLVGPPGCGKTLMTRVAVAAVKRLSKKKCFIAVVKPSAWESPFVGVTAANIRDSFDAFRKLADEGHIVIIFLDELESVGRIRGHYMGYHGDKQTAALLAELDGFAERGNVVVIAATNRKDLIDPALLERLSDNEVFVPRPDWDAAREIFQVHLDEQLPFSPNGSLAAETRDEVIDVALTRIYSPNAENELSRIKFRDGTQQTVTAGELMSGRLIEQICQSVRQRALVRDVQYDDAGIRVEDIEEAVSDALQRMSTTLTTQNVRSYLSDLPQDMDIVAVEPIQRRLDPAHQLLHDVASPFTNG